LNLEIGGGGGSGRGCAPTLISVKSVKRFSEAGDLNERGQPFNPKSVRAMLVGRS
jgi:hypothetical protein